MIDFKEHEGKLFRMLEEPVLLTTDAKLPCLVRLIQDDSRMGMFNRDTKPSRLSDFYLAARIVSNNIIVDEFMESDYHRFEIIGYPVEEGSDEWALYQMMQGKKVASSNGVVYWQDKDDNDLIKYIDGYGQKWIQTPCMFLKCVGASGWQIYKEPELKYKAGDFVEIKNWYSGTKHLGQIDSMDHEIHIGTHRFDISGKSVMERVPQLSIIHKLKPSEVIIHIGCLSGTVAEHFPGSDWEFRLIHGNGKESYISFHALDPRTRELVESLLKAQEEETK